MLKKIVAMTLLLVFVFAMIPAPAAAFSTACDRFRTCSTAFSCAWWGSRCALSDISQFQDITGEWW
jgi:hypothetical protein